MAYGNDVQTKDLKTRVVEHITETTSQDHGYICVECGIPSNQCLCDSLYHNEGYRCDRCEEFHEYSGDAENCCASISEVFIWQCDHCGTHHEEQDYAIECCASTTYIEGYACPWCETYFDEMKDAALCCLHSILLSRGLTHNEADQIVRLAQEG